jgi:hypothetical protein
VFSGGINTANHKIGYFKVDFLGEYESLFKKALTRGSVSQEEMFYFKKTEVEDIPRQIRIRCISSSNIL